MRSGSLALRLFLVLSLLAVPQMARAQNDLRAKAQNPVGSLISLPFKFTVDFGAPDGSAYVLSIQPVMPATVGEWNLISRIITPLIHVPGFFGGIPAIPEGAQGSSQTGLGDINYSLFVSPAAPGPLIWGLGPSISFPTATAEQLGSGKWSIGPTAVVLAQPKPWSLGVLTRQIWSFAGDGNRLAVSQFLLEPFVNYNLEQGWYLLTDPPITANWHADSNNRWTVPVGGGVGKLFSIGAQPINTRLEAYYNIERPTFGPDWSLSVTVQLLFPK